LCLVHKIVRVDLGNVPIEADMVAEAFSSHTGGRPMKAATILGVIAAAVLLAAGPARANHTGTTSICCAAKACPAGQTAVKGSSPSAAKCCTNPANPATCTPSPNAGYACNAYPNTSDPTDVAVGSGCIDGAAGTCTGGDAKVPAGCICVGGTCTTSECTPSAVDACCADGQCH
jgi:hypothetical protein